MSSDNQFTALGPAVIGFQTNGSNIDRGAEIIGRRLGVSGQADEGIGVRGASSALAGGAPGTSVGVLGEGQSVGVRGTSSNIGVEGISATTAGVAGRGTPGVFGRGDRTDKQGHVGVMGVVEGKEGAGVFGGHRTEGHDTLGSESFEPASSPGAGVLGMSNDDGVGVIGKSKFGHGIKGTTKGGVDLVSHGVFGLSEKTAGVAGISGRIPNIGDIAPPGHSGVYGFCAQGRGVFGAGGEQGVLGTSVEGNGVSGESERGRGGVFRSAIGGTALSAQLQLVPQSLAVPGTVPAQPLMFVPSQGLLAALPRAGRSGDLLATQAPAGSATLWFCVRGENGAESAQWSEVLLGVPLPGGG